MKLYEHPQHGRTHGYGPLDDARLIANGWAVVAPPQQQEAAQEDEPEPEKRKPGRPKKVQQ